MTMLMMLSFLIDQVQQLCCKVYQHVRNRLGSLRVLFEKIRAFLSISTWVTWHDLYKFIGVPKERPPPGEKGGLAFQG